MTVLAQKAEAVEALRVEAQNASFRANSGSFTRATSIFRLPRTRSDPSQGVQKHPVSHNGDKSGPESPASEATQPALKRSSTLSESVKGIGGSLKRAVSLFGTKPVGRQGRAQAEREVCV